MELKADSFLVRRDGILEASVDADTVLLGPDGNNYVVLNPTAARIWAHLEKGITFSQLLNVLTSTFDVERSACEVDVVALLTDFHRQRLIEIQGD